MTDFHSRSVYAEWLVSAFESRGVTANEIASVSGLGTELIHGTAPRLPLEDYLRLLNWAAVRYEDLWVGMYALLTSRRYVTEKKGVWRIPGMAALCLNAVARQIKRKATKNAGLRSTS